MFSGLGTDALPRPSGAGGVRRIGIRPCSAGRLVENAFAYAAVKVVEDVFSPPSCCCGRGRGAGGAPAADGAGQGQLAGGAGQGPPHRSVSAEAILLLNRSAIYHVQSRCPDRQRPEFRGEAPTRAGLWLWKFENAGYAVTNAIVPDEKGRIEAALRQW